MGSVYIADKPRYIFSDAGLLWQVLTLLQIYKMNNAHKLGIKFDVLQIGIIKRIYHKSNH